VIQLFKRMGWVLHMFETISYTWRGLSGLGRPRVILVEQFGTLRGLLTVKDVLRFTTSLESSHDAHDTETWDDYRGSLRDILEGTWVWTSAIIEQFSSFVRRMMGR
jgi:chloride channel 3/4/5